MFVVVRAASVPDHLRGYISRYLQEIQTNFYVGKTSARVADLLWERLCAVAGSGEVVMVVSASNDAGFSVRLHQVAGISLADFHGLYLPVSGE